MNSKAFWAAVAAIFIVMFGGVYVLRMSSSADTSSAQTADSQPVQASSTGSVGATSPTGGGSGSTPQTKSYTLADVSAHADASSCWTAINGKVYDLTAWINQHPGGPEAILSICGRDGSAAFNAQHGGQGRPASELATFFIGNLSK